MNRNRVLILLVAFLFLGPLSCSTMSKATDSLLGRNPDPYEHFTVTDDDVLGMMNEITGTPPANPGADVYNEVTGKFELTPEAHDRALRDGIVKRINDNKIKEYLAKYHPETWGAAMRKDAGTVGIVIVIIGVIGGLLW